VAKSGDWPGPQCIAALTEGESLRGTWFDRSAEFLARQRSENVLPTQFAKGYDIKLTPVCAFADNMNQHGGRLLHAVIESFPESSGTTTRSSNPSRNPRAPQHG
jgi:hypothetical protein